MGRFHKNPYPLFVHLDNELLIQIPDYEQFPVLYLLRQPVFRFWQ